MSFGSNSGRTRSGSKGFSSKEKKQRRRKQEYHVHKRALYQETGRPDPAEVKTRTILALDRLGHQVLSTEPGGYDLEDWTRSLNSLLDDFQEKVGADLLGAEFVSKKQEALSCLVPFSADEIDSEIERLTQEEAAARTAVDEAQRKASSRLASLREERDASAKELRAQREKLAEVKEARQSRQLFSRLLRSGPSTQQAETSVAALESKVKKLEDEIERARKARSTVTGDGDPEYIEARRRLEEAGNKLLELQTSKQDSLQLAHERAEATKTLSEMISALKLGGGASSDAEAQEG